MQELQGSWEHLDNALRRARAAGPARVGAVLDEDEHPCSVCDRVIGSAGRWFADGAGTLVPFCATCAGGRAP